MSFTVLFGILDLETEVTPDAAFTYPHLSLGYKISLGAYLKGTYQWFV